jgi:murein DD-endopeptidase MepM/ murein hydrolase activator NlpD
VRRAVPSAPGSPRLFSRVALIVLAGSGLLPGVVDAQATIRSLDRADPVYRQHQQLVSEYYQAVARDEEPPPLLLFAYRPETGDSISTPSLFEIASRLMIPYSAIATLNRIDSPSLSGISDPLLIPSRPGIFVPASDRTALEELIFRRLSDELTMERLTLRDPRMPEVLLFAPDVDFSPEERDTFLRVRFARPIDGGTPSSPFGYRHHPVTGVWSFHAGLDVAADFGTPVRAAADGVVRSIERDSWLGLSVTVDHRDGYSTVYAHLQEAFVQAGDTVGAGDPVGTVGSTGMSTGPHLHFEIRRNDEPRDPERYLR